MHQQSEDSSPSPVARSQSPRQIIYSRSSPGFLCRPIKSANFKLSCNRNVLLLFYILYLIAGFFGVSYTWIWHISLSRGLTFMIRIPIHPLDPDLASEFVVWNWIWRWNADREADIKHNFQNYRWFPKSRRNCVIFQSKISLLWENLISWKKCWFFIFA